MSLILAMTAIQVLLQKRMGIITGIITVIITVEELLLAKFHHFMITRTQGILKHIQEIMWKIIIQKQKFLLVHFTCLRHHLVILCLVVGRELVMLIKIRNVIIQCCQYLHQWIGQQILLIMINKGYQSQNLQY